MVARVTLAEIDPVRRSPRRAIERFENELLPALHRQEGYEGCYVLLSEEGKVLVLKQAAPLVETPTGCGCVVQDTRGYHLARGSSLPAAAQPTRVRQIDIVRPASTWKLRVGAASAMRRGDCSTVPGAPTLRPRAVLSLSPPCERLGPGGVVCFALLHNACASRRSHRRRESHRFCRLPRWLNIKFLA